MRINTVAPNIVTVPELAPQVADVARPTAIGPQTPSGAGYVQQAPGPQQPAQPAVPAEERRLLARRGTERRKRQVAVLLNLRVGQRRTLRRRSGDEAPPSIDTKV
jgi:hypothetical protein